MGGRTLAISCRTHQFRYERSLEPPSLDEGFATVEVREFERDDPPAEGRALVFDFDEVIALGPQQLEALRRRASEGWHLFAHAWRPQMARSKTIPVEVDAGAAQLRASLGCEIDVACCPHDAGPPACWCRKPIPGAALEFARRRGVSLNRSIVVGTSAADRTMTERIGARFEAVAGFLAPAL